MRVIIMRTSIIRARSWISTFRRTDHKAANSPESKLLGGKLLETQDVARSASPVTYITKEDPPFLVVHGNRDMTVPCNQSERLDAAIRESGIDVTFVTVDGGDHGGFVSPELTERVAAFCDKHLRGKAVTIAGGVVQNGRPERRRTCYWFRVPGFSSHASVNVIHVIVR
jgi:dipeptidyl aminopeptidase/acylaminoacyl peptidase